MSGVRVLRLEKTGSSYFFLKWSQQRSLAEELKAEACRLSWLSGRLLVAAVLQFEQDDERTFLLLSALSGESAQESIGRAIRPEVIVDQIASGLSRIHSIPVTDCPFDGSLANLLPRIRARIDAGLIDLDGFDSDPSSRHIEERWTELLSAHPATEDLVFTHGDFTLDNVLINDREISGFVDLGRAGLADRYRDLSIITRDLGPEWEARFFTAYGINYINREKLAFYRLVDEFF